MELAKQITFFRFKDGTEKEISKLTNEELTHALEYAESGLDLLDKKLNRLEKKQERFLAQGDPVPKEIRKDYNYRQKKNAKLFSLWEALKKEGSARGVCSKLKVTK